MLDLSGIWQCEIPGQTAEIRIPGTLDESRIGHADTGGKKWHPDNDTNAALYQTQDGIRTRLTRVVTYEGPARISRTLSYQPAEGKRVFLDVERSRHLTLVVNGQQVPACSLCTISTPYSFEVTGRLHGEDTITFISDNSYPTWPHDAIVFSSAATDETQTNWNGLLGYVRLREEAPVFIASVRVYPHGDTLDVLVDIDAATSMTTPLSLTCDALISPVEETVSIQAGTQTLSFPHLPLRQDVRRWDEGDGQCYQLTATMPDSQQTVSFGVRDFGIQDSCLTLNQRRVFLRSEANCAVFPETGYPPMTVEAWRNILATYRSYGVNCMRFHSHTPPEAAFFAADEMGMLMQPELSHWNPQTAFEDDASLRYYTDELTATLRQLANHPSFVMMTFGNELACGDLGHQRMQELLALAHKLDSTRLFACASNPHYGWWGHQDASDFYTSSNLRDIQLRATYAEMQGYLNHDAPGACHDYTRALSVLRQESDKPFFSFEVGQFEILPDFAEIDDFHGVTRAVNLEYIRRRVCEADMLDTWSAQVEATGESSLLCYREEVEAALRTEGYSGISLLGLQDFPGQGTALVGMLNSHLCPKPYAFAQPERFHAFFRDVLPLIRLPKYTYEANEPLHAPLCLANYSRNDVSGIPSWSLEGDGISQQGTLPACHIPCGHLGTLGDIDMVLPAISTPTELTLTVSVGPHHNVYPLYVYPATTPVCPANVHECRHLDDAALAILAQGGTVYLSPDSTAEALPTSVQAQFSPDFWSVGTFPKQSGCMGQLIDDAHPLFRFFPTKRHSTWQWWHMANQRAMVLPRRMACIIAEMDSYAYLRPMAQLLECRCGGGRLLISSLGLHQLQDYPEARALQSAMYAYLSSSIDLPKQTLSPEEVLKMVR